MTRRAGTPASTSGADRSGPYSPLRDPTILVLALIVVGSFLLLVAGAGTSLTGGAGGGPVFPLGNSEDGPTRVDLAVEANRTTLSVGQGVALAVTDDEGAPVANATVRLDDTTVRTDAEGRATVRVHRAGTRTVRVDKSGSNDTIYTAATAQLTVRRQPVALSLSVDERQPSVDETVAVELRRADTGGLVSGRVAVGNRTVDVEGGRANLSVAAAGEYTLRATRERTATERFDPATATLTVERLRRDLRVELSSEALLVGDLTIVSVTRAADGRPVDATVSVGDRTYSTGDAGWTVVENLSAGTYEVRATAASTDSVRFRPATTTLSVQRETVPLSVTVAPDRPDVGETASVRVTRADTGAPVRATVAVGGRTVTTDDEGRATVTFERPGNLTATATKGDTRAETFAPAETAVSVRGPLFAVESDLAVDVAVGDAYAVTATVRNTGNEPGTTTVSYRLAGEVVATRTVSLAPGASTTVSFGPYLAPVVAGTYDHGVATRTTAANGTLTVADGGTAGTPAPSTRNGGDDPETLRSPDDVIRAVNKISRRFCVVRKTS
jgi:hypothetical protein